MDITTASVLVAIITAVSASAERLVQILQNLLGGLLGLGPSPDTNPNPKLESGRKAFILLLSFGCCQATAFLSVPYLLPAESTNGSTGPIAHISLSPFAIGVLAMGGSSFWNSIQGYLNGIKKSVQPLSDALRAAQGKISAAAQLDILANAEIDAAKKQKLQTDAEKLRAEAAKLLEGIGTGS